MNIIKILETVKVYAQHDDSSEVIETLEKGELVTFTREKRRGGFDWYELTKKKEVFGYILKDNTKVFVCKKIRVTDDEMTGFSYVLDNEEDELNMSNFLYPVTSNNIKSKTEGFETFELYVSEKDNEKKIAINFQYEVQKVQIKKIKLRLDDEFYITNIDLRFGILMEVDNLKGKKGFVLAKFNFSELEDSFLQFLGIIIMIATAVGIIAFAFVNGWLVFGKILFLIGFVVAVAVMVIGLIIKSIVKLIFGQIRKRL